MNRPPSHCAATYADLHRRLDALLAGETDEIALMATLACEVHAFSERFNWTGFYRVVAPGLLKIGPYQGGHGCLTIPFDRGVCGACAREARTQLVPDVAAVPHHIACSGTTRSEIVIPVFDSAGQVRAVLDIDSDQPSAFDAVDQRELERIVTRLLPAYTAGGRFPGGIRVR
ncbi:MAG: GAF domain-containing protein [Verrucomicrobiales bacterium]|nr:GAF domain-containing protein [Verrucomicrobiales bacterium]MCP5525992.1 GAF domain-containing protein [Verrucomicrobiales bacterium]